MSVSIRLSRTGSKNHPFYRIVSVTTRAKRDGKNHAILGTYNPTTKLTELNKELYNEWVKKGAIVSATVKKLVSELK